MTWTWWDALPVQVLFGLENTTLQGFLLVLALAIVAWGFERYRTTFSKTEFWLALLISAGILTVGVAPGIYGAIAAALNIESRFITITILSNVLFVFLFMYVLGLVQGNRSVVNELARNVTIRQAEGDDGSEAETVAVVIPAYNESNTIGDVIDSLPDAVHGHDVRPIVVSDGSYDETRAVAESKDCTVVEHPVNQGQGGALKTGFTIARQRGADVIVTMDADGQHPSAQLGDLVEPIVAGDADYVIGSRYLGTNRSGNSLLRESGIRVFTAIVNFMIKSEITDVTSGYRAIRGSLIQELTLTEEQFSAPELIIESRKAGLRITEVPVTIRQRYDGETKKPGLGYAVGLLRTIVVSWIR